MTIHDLYLLSPELSMVGLATILLLLDLVVARKSLILGLGVVGLIVPLAFTVALWFTVGDDSAAENTGVLADTLEVTSSRCSSSSSSLARLPSWD